eukprot:s2557_g10.t1
MAGWLDLDEDIMNLEAKFSIDGSSWSISFPKGHVQPRLAHPQHWLVSEPEDGNATAMHASISEQPFFQPILSINELLGSWEMLLMAVLRVSHSPSVEQDQAYWLSGKPACVLSSDGCELSRRKRLRTDLMKAMHTWLNLVPDQLEEAVFQAH